MMPRFLYFDLGNVLLYFSHERQAAQMAQVVGNIAADRAYQILYQDGLHWDFERGALSEDQFYAAFCERCGARADRETLELAANDIFWLNVPMLALVGNLAAAGYRLGILSNTTCPHWRFCSSRFGFLNSVLSVHALSFRLRAMKPEPQIYEAAARLANASPEEIFFTDDRPEHVAAARAAGWDAIPFESATQVNDHLRRRGVITNY